MKNIHILPTDKPSRLHTYKGILNLAADEFVAPTIVKNDLINLNIYITNDEEIIEKDWFYDLDTKYVKIKQSWENSHLEFNGKKIILTTDQSLIQDGIQAIDDEFLEWFLKNPSCEEVEVKTRYLHYYKTGETFISLSKTPEFSSRNMQCIKIEPRYEIIIPKEEPKQETVEEAAERLWLDSTSQLTSKNSFIEGAEWQAERMYSEEDLISFARFYFREEFNSTMQNSDKSTDEILQEWFNQFKKK